MTVPQFELNSAHSAEWKSLDSFTQGYIEALFFTNSGDRDDEITADKGFSDLAPQTLATIIADCAKFQDDAKIVCCIDGREAEAGRDFWFTRNGHGVGFWDGDWDDLGEDAVAALECRADRGEVTPYMGGDGRVYLS